MSAPTYQQPTHIFLPPEILNLIAEHLVQPFTLSLGVTEEFLDVGVSPSSISVAQLVKIASTSPHFEWGIKAGIQRSFDKRITVDEDIFHQSWDLSLHPLTEWLFGLVREIQVVGCTVGPEPWNVTSAALLGLFTGIQSVALDTAGQLLLTHPEVQLLLFGGREVEDWVIGPAESRYVIRVAQAVSRASEGLTVSLRTSSRHGVEVVFAVSKRERAVSIQEVHVPMTLFRSLRNVSLEEVKLKRSDGLYDDGGNFWSFADHGTESGELFFDWIDSRGRGWVVPCRYLEKLSGAPAARWSSTFDRGEITKLLAGKSVRTIEEE